MTDRPVILTLLDGNQHMPDEARAVGVTFGHLRELWRTFDAMEHERDEQRARADRLDAQAREAEARESAIDHGFDALVLRLFEALRIHDGGPRDVLELAAVRMRERDEARILLSTANLDAGRAQGEAEALRDLLERERAGAAAMRAALLSLREQVDEEVGEREGRDREMLRDVVGICDAALQEDAGAALLAEIEHLRHVGTAHARILHALAQNLGPHGVADEVERLVSRQAETVEQLYETKAALERAEGRVRALDAALAEATRLLTAQADVARQQGRHAVAAGMDFCIARALVALEGAPAAPAAEPPPSEPLDVEPTPVCCCDAPGVRGSECCPVHNVQPAAPAPGCACTRGPR